MLTLTVSTFVLPLSSCLNGKYKARKSLGYRMARFPVKPLHKSGADDCCDTDQTVCASELFRQLALNFRAFDEHVEKFSEGTSQKTAGWH